MSALEKRKLGDFVNFIPGVNSTRMEQKLGTNNIQYYDKAAFEDDLLNQDNDIEQSKTVIVTDEHSLTAGDVVINNTTQLATIVTKRNEHKFLSLNFTKVEFTNQELDPRYFIYLFNSYIDVKKQKAREAQGNTILKITIKAMEQLLIPLVPITEQNKIGLVYVTTLTLQGQLTQYAKLLQQFTNIILTENLKGDL